MGNMSDEEIRLHVRAVVVLVFAMIAIAMLGEVSRQNWNSKVTAYPTKTEEAIEDYARLLLSEMTIEQKVGQMFYALDGADPETAAQYGLGGVLIGRTQLGNLNKSDVSALLRGYEAASEITPFLGVSEEGGSMVTVSGNRNLRSVGYLSPKELITTGGMKLVDSDAREKSDFLRELGFNMNFAPLCEVVTESDALLYDRAAPGNGDDVARYAETVTTAMAEQRVIGVLKYFPGYGNLKDAETVLLPTDLRSLEELKAEALQPFVRAIDAGAPAIMMGSTIVTAVDSQLPASLSRSVHQLLRRELGFDGLIISCDLQTSGLKQYGNGGELVVMAVQAGSDLLLTADYADQIEAVLRAVRAGTISHERIDESVMRILQLKIGFGMLQ